MQRMRWLSLLSVVMLVLATASHAQTKQPNLRSTDPAERAMGARRIAKTGVYSKEDVGLLVGCLGDHTRLMPSFAPFPTASKWVRDPRETSPSKEAEKALVRVGKAAVPKLIEVLDQKGNEWRRYAAARCLGDIRDKAALPHLKKLAEKGAYGHPHARGHDDEVPVAIAKIARKGAYDLLARVYAKAEQEKRVNSGLLEALGYCQDERFIPALQEQLRTGDRSRKLAVLIALGHTGSKKVIPLLLPYVNSEDWHMQKHSRDSLKELGRADLIPKEEGEK